MKFFQYASLLFVQLCWLTAGAQKSRVGVELLTTGTNTSLRGLSVVTDNIIWVSGSNGTVGRSSNGGKTWKWLTVKGFEKNDFRDIEAFDASTAIIMAVGDPAYILKTTDGGNSWKVVYENKTRGMFLDAMDFPTIYNGIVIGDPVDGRFFMAKTTDGGDTWMEMPADQRPVADSGEACFAASGTNIRYFGRDAVFFVSGGLNSRTFINGKAIDAGLVKGKESTGANSIAVYDAGKGKATSTMIVAGGDFAADSSAVNNCFYTHDGGKNWKAPHQAPHGYRSCIEYISKKEIVSCGLNGVDYSFDGGRNWTWISKEGFHTVRYAKAGEQVYLAGNNGKIGKLVLNNK